MELIDEIWGPKHISSFEAFADAANEFMQPRKLPDGNYEQNRFLFRGAADSSFSLIPSLARFRLVWGGQYSWLTDEKLYTIESDSLDAFTHKAQLYIEQPFSPKKIEDARNSNKDYIATVLHWWQIMQHYRAHTRLLDWTTSPYVALHFSVLSNPDRDGVVWMVENGAHEDQMHKMYTSGFSLLLGTTGVDPSSNDLSKNVSTFKDRFANCITFFRATSPTNRMCAQQGWFSCASVLTTNHEEAIAATFKNAGNSTWAKKLIISKSAKSDIMRRLWTMSITGETLFPGLDGLGLAIAQIPDLLRPLNNKEYQLNAGQLTVCAHK